MWNDFCKIVSKTTLMKNIILFIATAASIMLTSCKGDPGPPGEPGGMVYAQVFEANVGSYSYDATFNQLYSNFYSFPFTVYERAAVLAYRYQGPADTATGDTADTWPPSPH